MKAVLTQEQLNRKPVFDDVTQCFYTDPVKRYDMSTGEPRVPAIMATFSANRERAEITARARQLRDEALGGEA